MKKYMDFFNRTFMSLSATASIDALNFCLTGARKGLSSINARASLSSMPK